MCKRTDRDEINARFRNGPHGREAHTTAGLGLRPAADHLHRRPQLLRRHVVEQDDVRSRGDRLGRLIQRVGLNLDF